MSESQEPGPSTSIQQPPQASQAPRKASRRRFNPLTVILLLSGGLFALFLAASAVFFLRAPEQGDGAGLFGRAGGVVGVVEVKGIILESQKTTQHLKDMEKNPSVKAIVLRVDSPGGAVAPSQEIHEMVKGLSKPVVTSMGNVAASGGYYIAMGTKKIFANPGTITGSIGVIMEFANLEKLYEWARIQRYSIKTGKFKSIGADYRAMTQEERELLERMAEDVLSQFKRAVAEGRNLRSHEVDAIADGRIFSGAQAKAAGLVDELGSFQQAVEEAARLGGIEGKPRLHYPRKERPRWLDLLMEEGSVEGLARTLTRAVLGDTASLPSGLYWLWSAAR